MEQKRKVRISSMLRGVIIGVLLTGYGLVVKQFQPSFAALFVVGAALQVGVLLMRKFVPDAQWPKMQEILELIADAATVVVFAVAVMGSIARVPDSF